MIIEHRRPSNFIPVDAAIDGIYQMKTQRPSVKGVGF